MTRAAGYRIAILGWGSLLWEGGIEFDRWHGPWQLDGPTLSLEFSRISDRRLGALTLVIDPEHGVPTTVAWCLSKRKSLADAVCDLRSREETTHEKIGQAILQAAVRERVAQPSEDLLVTWAREKRLDAAIWTALESNFAAEYIWRAPAASPCSFISTEPQPNL